MVSSTAENAWYTDSPAETAAAFDVEPTAGLSTTAVRGRQQKHGRNLLVEGGRIPVRKKVLRLLADKMILVLVAAAAVSAVVSREWETPVVIFAVAGPSSSSFPRWKLWAAPHTSPRTRPAR